MRAAALPATTAPTPAKPRRPRPVDPKRDHVRGGEGPGRPVTVVIYGDFLCTFCRRLRRTLAKLRETLGGRMRYVFRHFPNEDAHPGAELMAQGAEAAAAQGRFWEMYDALYGHDLPLDRAVLLEIAKDLGLDLTQFRRDLNSAKLKGRVREDFEDGLRRGVEGTPTIYVDGHRYDGAWDYHSMLQGIQQPLGQAIGQTARAFANLPSAAALVLLAAAGLALALANGPLAGAYHALVAAPLGVGPTARLLTLTVADWSSEGLLAIFFFVLGLEIRREMATGSLTDPRAAVAPLLAAVGSVAVPALLYLAVAGRAAAAGWPVPTDTGVAFTLAVLALFGASASAGLKTFVAIYAVANDLLTVLLLALVFPHGFQPAWLLGAAAATGLLIALNQARVFAAWPYVMGAAGLWVSLHAAGVDGALSGIVLAAVIPSRPIPDVAPLLAQAATALATLEHAQKRRAHGGDHRTVREEPVWDWSSRNLAAASDRLSSPADRAERAVEPWSTYLVLPLFAFTATGASLAGHLDAAGRAVGLGVGLGYFLGKPLGILLPSWAAARLKIAVLPANTPPLRFVATAVLCGIGDPFAFLLADKAFTEPALATAAKLGVFGGSLAAAALGAGAFAASRRTTGAADHSG